MNNLFTRYLTIKLILDKGQFPGSVGTSNANANVKVITCNSGAGNITADVNINIGGGFSPSSANVIIFGLLEADINAYSRYSNPFQLFENSIEIYAGYSLGDNGLPPLIYSGQIIMAGADLNNPSRAFIIKSMTSIINQNTVVAPTNPKGQISLNDLFGSIVAQQQGLSYTPNGVTGFASSPVYMGSVVEQMQQATADYNYQMKVLNNQVLVSPKGQPLVSQSTSLNATNGMLGYPAVTEFGIDVRCRFNPSIQFGQTIEIESKLNIANGQWWINGMSHVLQNQGAKWESLLHLNPFSFFAGTAS